MGTRNLTCVVENGEFKVAQYGQWDGYPTCAGSEIIEALKGKKHVLRRNLNNVHEITDKELQDKRTERNTSRGDDFINMAEKYPTLQCDLGWGIIKYIITADPDQYIPVQLEVEFASNSLFCEYCWVVDLDKDVLELYVGFNKKPVGKDERFAFLNDRSVKDHKASTCGKNSGNIYEHDLYYPVRFYCSWPLDNLPAEDDMKVLEQKINNEKETQYASEKEEQDAQVSSEG